MIVEETFYRPEERGREARTLPAATYNLAHTLLARAPNACLFVPIRSMQFLGVIDAEEIIFVDRERGHLIELAWQRFRPGAREALDAPVAYEAVYYSDSAAQTMGRLQGEFHKALVELQSRAPTPAAARVIALPRERH